MKRWIAFSVLFGLMAVTSIPCSGAGLIIVEDAHWWPGPIPPQPVPPPWPPRPMPPRPHLFAPLEVTSVKVATKITDQIAATSIDQEFYNPNSSRLEGTFVFPIPAGAHLDRFTMEIDGKPVAAELLAADKARRIYEDIVRKLKDPALLEYAGRDIFKVRIFPIEPQSRKRITLSYTQLLKVDDGLVRYNLALDTERFSAKPVPSLSIKVDLESKRPLKTIYSPSHAVEIKRRDPTHATAGFEATQVQPDTDFALYFAAEKDEIGVNLLANKTGGEDGYFLLLASPGVDVKQKQVILKDVAFVLDTSGSMAGQKIEQAKKALQMCVENLNDGDRFEILRFSTEIEPLFDQLVQATTANRAKAQAFIKELKAAGGTAIDEALQKALALRTRSRTRESAHLSGERDNPGDRAATPAPSGADRPFVVIFLTDGRPTIGTTDEDEILASVKKRGDGRTRIFSFGIGTDVNTHLLDRITEATRAFSQYVLPEEDLELKVSSFYSKIKEPVLANPTLKFSGEVHAAKLYPSALPDLFKGEQLVLVGRYSGHGDAALTLEGDLNGATRKTTYEVKFPDSASDNAFIPRLWATRRVGYLLDEIRLHGDNAELRDEVTELARKYGIVTPYTAYLILEDEGHRGVPTGLQSFRQLREDSAAYSVAGRAFDSLSRETSGDAAVATALSGNLLKQAQNAPSSLGAAPEQSALFMRGQGVVAVPVPSAPRNAQAEAAERVTRYTQQQRFVGGKNFFQNGQQWVDASVQQQPNAQRVRLQFGSPEYFELAAKQPKALPWLALGQNVQFVLDSTVYEIYE